MYIELIRKIRLGQKCVTDQSVRLLFFSGVERSQTCHTTVRVCFSIGVGKRENDSSTAMFPYPFSRREDMKTIYIYASSLLLVEPSGGGRNLSYQNPKQVGGGGGGGGASIPYSPQAQPLPSHPSPTCSPRCAPSLPAQPSTPSTGAPPPRRPLSADLGSMAEWPS